MQLSTHVFDRGGARDAVRGLRPVSLKFEASKRKKGSDMLKVQEGSNEGACVQKGDTWVRRFACWS